MAIFTREFNKLDFSDPVKAAEQIKQQAIIYGADSVGIGSIDRWDGIDIQTDPKQIMPECKSVISMVFRLERGSIRAVEEGTFFNHYATTWGALNRLYIPMTVNNLARFIEDQGYEVVPYGSQNDWSALDESGKLKPDYSRPARKGQAMPDVEIDLRIAAYLCGLGEIGYSGRFLSPLFGPRIMIGIMLTELELAADPIYNGPKLCNRCKACVHACPGSCISADKTVKVKAAGHELEWAQVDMKKCMDSTTGTVRTETPKDDPYIYGDAKTDHGDWSPFYNKPTYIAYDAVPAICGGRGCIRACMISLESRGVLENKFKQEFRRRPEWTVDWSAKSEEK